MSDTTSDRPRGEVQPGTGQDVELERKLDLGEKVDPAPSPGMPEASGGGLHSEIGHTPPHTDPDR